MSFWNRKKMRTSETYTHDRMVEDHAQSIALFLASYPDKAADEIPVERNDDDDVEPNDTPEDDDEQV